MTSAAAGGLATRTGARGAGGGGWRTCSSRRPMVTRERGRLTVADGAAASEGRGDRGRGTGPTETSSFVSGGRAAARGRVSRAPTGQIVPSGGGGAGSACGARGRGP